MDWLNGLFKSLDYNRGSFIGPLIALLVILLVTVGCTSTTNSLLIPGEQVDRITYNDEVVQIQGELAVAQAGIQADIAEHNLIVETRQTQIELGYTVLDESDVRAAKFIELTGALATQVATGGVTAPGLIASMLTLGSIGYGVGKGYDNRRKDNKIVELKGKVGSGNAT